MKTRRDAISFSQLLPQIFCVIKDIFLKKVARERRIPFELSADPFYSESNMAHLRRGIFALNAGKGVEHEPIEAEDE